MSLSARRPSSRVSSRLVSVIVGLALAALAPDRVREVAFGRVADTASRAIRASGSPADTPALPDGVAADWWTAVQARLQAEAYGVRPDTGAVRGVYEADNPAQGWRTRFSSAGVAITPARSPAAEARKTETGADSAAPSAAEDWTVGLRLAAYGAGDVLTPVPAAAPRAEGARVEFRYGESDEGAPALTEWYVNEARGLEHGFTLAVAPAGAGPVKLELAVAGGLLPILERDGLAVELCAPDGAARVRYADLLVTDAGGRTLPSHMAVPTGKPARIQLVVDTRGATYPVTIDPLATTPSTTLWGAAASNYFGVSVATAGDVNGDGYADVVVGAKGYSSSTGRAYVYLGAAGGLPTAAATTLTGEAASNLFGGSVAPAGDVNGDGYADVVVGAKGYSGSTGRAYLYLGSASGLATSAATTLTGEAAGDEFGGAAVTAGDVNGDGYADIVVGARRYSSSTGRAYVYLGSASGLETTAAATLTGEAASNEFGGSVATAGDVNGDGYADLVVGAYAYGSSTGRAYVYLGSASGLETTATTLDGETSASSGFGVSVATAGDVNGDGYADVVVGAHNYNSSTGRTYVFLGGAGGLETTAATTLTGAGANYNFGQSVATAGDVNGDGYADVVVGAPGYGGSWGQAYLYLGGSSGLVTTAAATRTGAAASDSFGQSVAPAGDVNGDGYADVVVGAPRYSSSTGRAYVYLGGPAGLATTAATTLTGEAAWDNFGVVATAGDVNGDGYADVVVGAAAYGNGIGRAYVYLGGAGGLATSAATTLTGAGAAYYFGGSVATAGDVNGDGYADVVIGASGYSNFTGRAYVYLGGPSGLATTAATTLTGAATSDNFGSSVATAGDVNGDGYADVVIGAYGYSTNPGGYSNNAGRAYVFLGGPSGLGTTVATTLTGAAGYRFGSPVATAGDVNGDGYADVVVGAPGYSTSTGRATVYLGSASGLTTTAASTMWGAANSNNFGGSVATAGDVNGDGYADLVVGAQGYNSSTGRAYVYLGGPSGLGVEPTAATTLTGEAASNSFGLSVATAGDVNGDGYADVLVGAYAYSSNTGRAYLYAGNGGLGRSVAARTRRADDSAPVAYGGRSEAETAFRLAALGHSPFGRTQVKLEWEVKPLGATFNGSGTSRSTDWYDTTAEGASLNELASGLTQATAYHWRVRVRYHPASGPFAQYSRWMTQPWGGWRETRLRTAAPNTAPTATGVNITGTLLVGELLTGHYTYGDVDGDAEGTSTFRWLRGGSPIAGATALTYTTVVADSGQTITFEVTPRAATGLTPGGPVTSTGVVLPRSTPVVTWANPASIVYGTPLGATQLNATASVPGTFAYTPVTGTYLDAGAGQTLSVTFTPTDTLSYTTATKTVTIDVTIATPVITWANPAGIVYGTALSATQLNASADTAGAFAYTPAAGTVLNAGAGQTLSVTFTPTSPDNYTTATKTVTIDVTKATPVVTWANPASIVYGTALGATQLNATANVAGSFAYTPAAGTVLNVGAGQTLSVTFTPADPDNYTTATKTATIDVTIATPLITWANPAAILDGTALSAMQLNATADAAGAFVYTPPAGTVLSLGVGQTLSVTFTPTDLTNYMTATKTVLIDVVTSTGPPAITDVAPGSGAIGSGVTVTGTGFTGATGLTFHGVPAAYTVASDTQLTATVPAGTTTGPVRVTTPSGTAASATDFIVTNQRASRSVPACYVPGFGMTVSVDVVPAPEVLAHAVADTPPAGWTTGTISDGGAWDAPTSQVKWGPFLDAASRVLTYVVTAPAGTTGTVAFAGVASFDGVEVPLGGTAILDRCEQHPADANSDFRMVIGEVTGYGAAWKKGNTWTVPPVPIPIGYVTRAGYLWRVGEAYRRDAGDCPVCWMPLTPVPLPFPDALLSLDDIPTPRGGPWYPESSEIVRSPGASLRLASARGARSGLAPGASARLCSPGASAPGDAGVAVRQAPTTYVPTVPLTVTLTVTPDGDVQTWALEETVPAGWRVSAVSADGFWNEHAGVIRWGPFFDEAPQTLRYTLTPLAGASGPQELRGTASFDGADVTVTGIRMLQRAPITRPGDPGSPAAAVTEDGRGQR